MLNALFDIYTSMGCSNYRIYTTVNVKSTALAQMCTYAMIQTPNYQKMKDKQITTELSNTTYNDNITVRSNNH